MTTFLVAIVNRGLNIAVGIVLARYLGPVGKGYIAYAPIALAVFVTAMNGVAQAVTYQYGRNRLPGGAVHRAMRRIVTAVSIPAVIGLALVAWFVPSQHVLIYSAIALPFAMYATSVSGLLVGADRISATNVQSAIISSGFNAITVALVVAFHADYNIVLIAWVVSYVAGAAYSYMASRPFIRDCEPASREIVREQASFAAKSGVAQLLGFVNMRIDVFVVSFALGAGAVGLYTLAVGLAEMAWQFTSPLCIAAFPRIAIGDEQAAARFTARLLRHILIIIVPVGVLCFIVGPSLITLVYGQAFAASGGALRWILPGVVAYAVEVPLGYYLMVRLARPWTIVTIQSASIVACAAITLATVRTYGIDGAAAATSLTYIAVVIAKGVIFARQTKIAPRTLLLLSRDDVDAVRDLLIGLASRIVTRATAPLRR